MGYLGFSLFEKKEQTNQDRMGIGNSTEQVVQAVQDSVVQAVTRNAQHVSQEIVLDQNIRIECKDFISDIAKQYYECVPGLIKLGTPALEAGQVCAAVFKEGGLKCEATHLELTQGVNASLNSTQESEIIDDLNSCLETEIQATLEQQFPFLQFDNDLKQDINSYASTAIRVLSTNYQCVQSSIKFTQNVYVNAGSFSWTPVRQFYNAVLNLLQTHSAMNDVTVKLSTTIDAQLKAAQSAWLTNTLIYVGVAVGVIVVVAIVVGLCVGGKSAAKLPPPPGASGGFGNRIRVETTISEADGGPGLVAATTTTTAGTAAAAATAAPPERGRSPPTRRGSSSASSQQPEEQKFSPEDSRSSSSFAPAEQEPKPSGLPTTSSSSSSASSRPPRAQRASSSSQQGPRRAARNSPRDEQNRK